MKVGKEIALEAKKKAICKEWFSNMTKQNDIKPLCEMYFKGSDWAMENDFPSLAMLRRFKGNSDHYGLHTDFVGSVGLLNSVLHQSIAFFGNSVADVICEPFAVCEIIIRHNSKVKITAEDQAYLVVNLLDNAEVEIEAKSATVKVYRYGDSAQYRASRNVEIIEKTWQK